MLYVCMQSCLKSNEYYGAMGCGCAVLVVLITKSSLEITSVFEDKKILNQL